MDDRWPLYYFAAGGRLIGVCCRPEGPMNIALYVGGVILVLMGAIWFLQGINILPGSFMTGQIQWAVYGGIAVVVGVLLVARARRRTVN